VGQQSGVDVLTPRRIVAVSISRLEVDAQLRPRLCPAPCHVSPVKPSLPLLLMIEALGATKPSTATIWHTQTAAMNLDRAIDVVLASVALWEPQFFFFLPFFPSRERSLPLAPAGEITNGLRRRSCVGHFPGGFQLGGIHAKPEETCTPDAVFWQRVSRGLLVLGAVVVEKALSRVG